MVETIQVETNNIKLRALQYCVFDWVYREMNQNNIDKKKTSQLLLEQNAFTIQEKYSTFYIDLCDVLVSTNIPLWKMSNLKLKDFLEMYRDM
uniref:Uncharacterized protein n=1 Tax=Timema bartmani TaxID=61472 RepID=A0A7R9I620_9NEOP|nr:unnamed protein product [Timema bartmani]